MVGRDCADTRIGNASSPTPVTVRTVCGAKVTTRTRERNPRVFLLLYWIGMTKLKVGVLRGGPGGEYDVSLKTGKTVLNALPREKYEPIDIFIDRGGEWHVGGYPLTPDRALKHIDVAWNALLGENAAGGIQQTLDALHIPYTGSNALSSAIASHRLHARKQLADSGIRVPISTHFDAGVHGDGHIIELFRSFPHPLYASPAWSSEKRALVSSFDELREAIEYYSNEHPVVFLDAHIPGTTVWIAVIENIRGDDLYTAIPVNALGEPVRLSDIERKEIWETARRAHKTLGARHYSLSEFTVSPRGIYLIETKTAPALEGGAVFQKSLSAVGVPFPHFLDHVLDLSRGPRK